jgi:hypothetical protein
MGPYEGLDAHVVMQVYVLVMLLEIGLQSSDKITQTANDFRDRKQPLLDRCTGVECVVGK